MKSRLLKLLPCDSVASVEEESPHRPTRSPPKRKRSGTTSVPRKRKMKSVSGLGCESERETDTELCSSKRKLEQLGCLPFEIDAVPSLTAAMSDGSNDDSDSDAPKRAKVASQNEPIGNSSPNSY